MMPCVAKHVQFDCLLAPADFRCNDLEVLLVGKHPELVKVPTSLTHTSNSIPRGPLARCLSCQVEREIRIHSGLDHANIIQLYAAFEDDANVYMVQEYATGNHLQPVTTLTLQTKCVVAYCIQIKA